MRQRCLDEMCGREEVGDREREREREQIERVREKEYGEILVDVSLIRLRDKINDDNTEKQVSLFLNSE